MENQETKTGYYALANTVRISPVELEFVNDNYEEIAGTYEKISFSKFFMQAVTKAVSTVKSKTIEITKDNPDHLQRIAELEASNNDLIQKLKEAENKPKGLVLNFSPEWRKHFWALLEISKKDGYAQSYEELITKVFNAFHQRNELVLDKADWEYLKTLEYNE